MTRAGLIAAAAAAWMTLAPAARAQEEAPAAAPEEAAQEAPKRKPRPKPKPKPQAKPPEKPSEKLGERPGEKPAEKPAEAGAPEAKPSAAGPARTPAPASRPAPEAPTPPANPIPAAGSAMNFATPPVVCEPGQAVHYQGAKNAELWVTRSGTITIDNPLRPLTPDVTRVLQVVVGSKVATAYGPDVLSLRRGGSPATLEGTIGGRIQWDASLLALPDSLPINTETGQPLAELRFHECGTAPSAKLLPPPKARRMAPTPEVVAAEAEKAEKAAKAAARAAVKPDRAKPAARNPAGQLAPPAAGLPPPRAPGLQLPQGAIP